MSFIDELKRRNVLRVALAYLAGAWLLIQIIETLFPIFGYSDAAIRMSIALLAIGFPIAAIVSWLYELTPEGLKLERDVDRSQLVSAHAGRKFDRGIIAVLTLAIVFFAVDKFVLGPAREARVQEEAAERARGDALAEYFGDNSIAVLPFDNRSDEPDDVYFSDGISEELLNLLSRVDRLRVVSRSSSFAFRDQNTHLPTIAEQLQVGLVLDGSIRRFGDDVRISVWLTDARSNTELWSETYERRIDDVFQLQDEISSSIVSTLAGELGLEIGASPLVNTETNREAHDAYLRGRYLIAQNTPNANRAAVREFQKAVSLDPQYALGHAELAIAMMKSEDSLLREQDGLTWEQLYADIEQHVDTAMSLNPDLAESQAAEGRLLWNKGRDQEALKYYKASARLNQSYSDAYIWLANFYLRWPNSIDDTYEALKAALRVDPLSRSAHWNYIFALIQRNQLDEAARKIEEFSTIDPKGATVLRGLLDSLGGNTSNFILAYLTAVDNRPDDIILGQFLSYDMRYQLEAIGLTDEALRLANREDPEIMAFLGDTQAGVALARQQLAEDPRSVSPLAMGLILAHAGQYDEAQPYLERFWDQNGSAFARDDFYTSYVAEALHFMRRRAGDDEGADEVLAALWDNIRRFRDAGISVTYQPYYSIDYQEGIAAYLSGDRELALKLISRAVDDGFDIPPGSPFQQARYQDPDFVAILDRQAARKKREQARTLAVVCNDNPSPDIWQPTVETCSR